MKKTISLLTLLLIIAFGMHAKYMTVNDTIIGSDIYPGTTHTMCVTIPVQADRATPLALYMGLDGILCNAPDIIDSLSTCGLMPPTVCVFLQPGVIADGDGGIIRYNRSNEFDATDDRFSRFIELQVLPRVDSILRADGRGLALSTNSADRMIFGLSSGGIAAFTAAWHRPDMFGKVFTGCGTYVPMRGGHNLQAIVRKHEPKPLRIFMQDGSRDAWNPLFGSWYEANRVLASALEFAGYDCDFEWDDSAHSVKRSSEIFADVMKWMWRDGSRPLTRGKTSNNLLAPMLIEDSGWESSDIQNVPHGHNHTHVISPDSTIMATTADNSNYLTQYIIDASGTPVYGQPFYWLHTYTNGALTIADMEFDSDGNLWVLTDAGIQICDQNGRVRGILELPRQLDLGSANIHILQGQVLLRDHKNSYTRRLNVRPATPGKRPASQGQA